MLTEAAWPLVPNYVARAIDLVNLGELDPSEVAEYVQYLREAEIDLAPFFGDDQRPYKPSPFGLIANA